MTRPGCCPVAGGEPCQCLCYGECCIRAGAKQEAPELTDDWLVSDSELAGKIMTLCGLAVGPSLEPGADGLRDRIAAIIAADRTRRSS